MRRVARILVALTAIGMLAIGVVQWVRDDVIGPGTCLDFSDDQVAQPTFNAARGEWLYAGKVVGYSSTDDPTCVSPPPR